MIFLRTLGELSLTRDGLPVLLGRRKPLAMLTYLALRAGRPTSRDTLADLLWGSSGEANARKSLRQCLSELRGEVGLLIREGDEGVSIDPSQVSVDVLDLDASVRERRWGDPALAVRGEFLAGGDRFGDDAWRTWLDGERVRIGRMRARGFAGLVSEAEASGESSAIAAAAHSWRVHDPNAVSAWLHEAVALRDSGRIPEAQDVLAEARQHFMTEDAQLPDELAKLARTLSRLGAAGRAGQAPLLTPDLVGRSGALARLVATRDHLRSGANPAGRRAVIIAAEGLGKTRLLREFSRQTRQATPQVAVTAAVSPSGPARGWSLVAQVVDGLASHDALAGLSPDQLAVLATLAPRLRESFRHLPEGTALDATNVEEALHAAITEVAEASGCVVLIDDLADGDADSVEVLATLVQRPPARALVVAASRPGSWEAQTHLGMMRSRLDPADRIALEPLSADEIRRVTASMVPLVGEPLDRVANAVASLSGGIPSVIVSLISHATATGRVVRTPAGSWEAHLTALDALVPPDLADRWRDRVAALDQEMQRIVGFCAVLADPEDGRIERAVLEGVSDLDASQFGAALDRALREGILHFGEDAATFTADAFRRLARQGLAPSTVQEVERRAVRWLDQHGTRNAARATLRARLKPARPTARRWTTWLAVATVVLAAGWWFVARPSADTPAGTMVVLADVQNLTGDTSFTGTLSLAATIGLQQSRQVTLFPRSRIRETLALMQRPNADTVFDEALAREVAARENLTRVAAFSIAKLESTFVVTARVIDPRSGDDLFADQERAASRTEVLPALDRLIGRVREATGEPTDTVRVNTVPLPRVTTASLGALEAYSRSQVLWSRRDYPGFKVAVTRALELDSSFALAWLSLAEYHYLIGRDGPRGDSAFRRAQALATRLSERERIRLAMTAARQDGRREESIRLAEQLARRYPEAGSWYSFGTTLMQSRRCAEAIPAFQRSLALDPRWTNSHLNMATCHQFLGAFPAAIAAYLAAYAVDSASLYQGTLNHEFGLALVKAGLVDSAERVHRRMTGQRAPLDQQYGYRSLGYVAALGGRYRQAGALFDTAVAIAESNRVFLSAYRGALLAGEHALTIGETSAARAALDRAWTLGSQVNLAPTFAMFAGSTYARARMIPRARAMRDTVVKYSRPGPADATLRAILAARIALATGDAAAARRELVLAVDTTRFDHVYATAIEVHEALGQPDSAYAAATSLVARSPQGSEEQDRWLRAHLTAGRLAEQVANTDDAMKYYQKLMERVGRGDPELPFRKDAERALARLRAARP
jgi:DNA-binding SARP family transcriptional activator/tetratricopeptide (TPR) repeat protein